MIDNIKHCPYECKITANVMTENNSFKTTDKTVVKETGKNSVDRLEENR